MRISSVVLFLLCALSQKNIAVYMFAGICPDCDSLCGVQLSDIQYVTSLLVMFEFASYPKCIFLLPFYEKPPTFLILG